MIISLDFDDVLIRTKGKFGVGRPVPGAIEALAYLKEAGHTLVILTAHKNLDDVRDFLFKHGHADIPVSNVKQFAHVYIDDRAYRHEDWAKTMAFIQEKNDL